MRRRAQPYLPGFEGLRVRDFGGSLLDRGNPRRVRPISTGRAMHLVMRSSRATGALSLLSPRRAKKIEALVRTAARRQNVRLYRYANSGNHLHLLIQARSPRAYKAYVRTITGLIARLTLGKERGKGRKLAQGTRPAETKARRESSLKKSRFWDARPFTRIVEWGRDFRGACAYVVQNRLEALGFIPYRPRSRASPKKGKR